MMADKIALVTGASRGLGAALAEQLATTHHVVAVARTTGGLEELDDRIQAVGGQATLAPMDITDAGAMAHLCRSIYDRWGSLSIWVHSAIHAPPLSPADHIDAKDWQKTAATNITATAQLIPMVSPLLQGKGATAVFFDDTHVTKKFFGAYSASKAAQIRLAQSWQAETSKSGPTIHIAKPAAMPTATRARFFPGEDREKLTAPSVVAREVLAQLPQ